MNRADCVGIHINIMENISGKFTKQLILMRKWIQQREKFLFLCPDYVVVGLSMEEYIKHFPSKDEADKEHQIIIIDEATPSEETYKKLESMLNERKKNEGGRFLPNSKENK